MNKKKTQRNAPCPCGSEKKHKHCCYQLSTYSFWKEIVSGLLVDALSLLMKQEGKENQVWFAKPEWKDALNIVSKNSLKDNGLTEDQIISFSLNRRLLSGKSEHGIMLLKIKEDQV